MNNNKRNIIKIVGILIIASVLGYIFVVVKSIQDFNYVAPQNTIDLSGNYSTNKMSFFVTSKNPGQGANFGGLLGADNYCQALAEKAGSNGLKWHAYLSTTSTALVPGVNARDRIGAGPWYNFKGELIANNVEELQSNNKINKQTALTEYGEVISGRGDAVNNHDILTGSTAEGKASTDSVDTTCSNWTSNAAEGSAIVGHHDRTGLDDSDAAKSWNSAHASKGCGLENLKTTGGAGLLYCFGSAN